MEIGLQANQLGRTATFSEGATAPVEPAARPVQTGQAGERVLSKAELSKEIDGINKWLQSTNTHVKFTLHEELNEYYVQVINDQTQEVIREIPSKKMMDMVAKFHEMVGLLVDEKR